MDGSSKQPSTADITAMDGSGNNKTNSNNSNSNSSKKRTHSNVNNDTETSSVTSSPLASTAIGDSGYCTAGPSTPMATMMTCNGVGTKSISSFALPTPIPPSSPGCGCIVMGPPTLDPEEITINITPTIGGPFDLTVDRNDTIENLKKIISKRLKVAKERICLLHCDRQLREGTLKENRLQNGSRLTLLPSVETGLMGQRPEQTVMQALESLNDSQVNDFLSGKAPLNLTMRLGDQMMLIQLQLSTVAPASSTTTSVINLSGVNTSPQSSSLSTSSSTSSSSPSSPCENSSSTVGNNNTSTTSTTTTVVSSNIDSLSMPMHRRSSDHFARSMRIAKQNENNSHSSTSNSTTTTTTATTNNSSNTTPTGASSLISSFASALRAAVNCSNNISTALTTTNPCPSERTVSASPASLLPSSTPFWQRRQLFHHRHHHHHPRNRIIPPWQSYVQTSTTSTPTTSLTEQTISSPAIATNSDDVVAASSTTPCTPQKKKLCTMGHHHSRSMDNVTSRSSGCDSNSQSSTNSIMGLSTNSKVATATLDTRALAEASRNLTQKLKQLSSEEHARRRQGAIIESMHHHGKGVYSGTFSGTLNPALQDRHGRPKRDISTIIHILNDLLCATPAATASHYRHHHRHNSGRQQSSTSSNSGVTNATSPNGSNQESTPGYSMEELSRENEATKGKMRRLRFKMEQRRAKRKARRQARAAAPYTTQWAALTPDPSANHDPNTTSSSTSGTNTTEPQNEPELQPCSPEPVVA